ncbi:MAG: glutathione S-transferase family protein [Sphingomonadales bacterium]
MDEITLYGDSISGNCLKVKFVADRLGIPYRWIEIDVLKQETRTPEFLAMNPAGQVPLICLADGRYLAQSNAIMLHLAEGSDLVPADAFERALMFQWLFWEQYSHEPVIAVRRFQKFYLNKPDAEIDASLMPRGEKVLGLMNDHLVARRYFVGDSLSLADVALVAYTRLAHEGGFDLAGWPEVLAWVRRVEGNLGLALHARNLYEAIRERVEPFGGIDLPDIPREPIREPPDFSD